MLIKSLQTKIDINEALKRGLDLHGTLAVTIFPRLLARLQDSEGEINFRIYVSKNIDSQERIHIHAEGSVSLQCQRCLKTMQSPLNTDVTLVPIYNADDTKLLDIEEEPLDLTGDAVTYLDILEDECLLALPQIPLHDPKDCCAELPDPEFEATPKRENPFKVLKGLKDDKNGK